MTTKFRLPHYFAYRVQTQISELYVSTAIADLAIALVLLFEPIFLYATLGFSVPQVLLFFAAVYAFYIVLIPFGAKIVSRFGYAHGIFFSIPFQILYWFLLFGAKDNFALIYFAPIAFAIEKSLFWPSFHAIVARFARDEQRGREFSMLYAIVNIMQAAGPFIGGLVAEKFGIRTAFIVAGGVYFCSFIPLFASKEVFTPKIYQWRDTWDLFATYPLKFLGYMGFGEELLVLTVWPIFIYLIIKDFKATGAIVTTSTFIATILLLYIGKMADQYRKRLMIKIGSFLYVLVWLARFIVATPFGAFVIDTLSRTSKDLVFVPMSTVTYERAEATHILPYIVFFEQSLSVGKFLAAVLGVIIFALTGSFFALFAAAAVFSLLYMLI